jgi:hypothetical protein
MLVLTLEGCLSFLSMLMFNHFFFISVSFLIGVLVFKFMVVLNMFMLLVMLLLPIVLIG